MEDGGSRIEDRGLYFLISILHPRFSILDSPSSILNPHHSPEESCQSSFIWYADKYCASCGKQFADIHWLDNKPALLSPEGKTVEWSEIPPENVPGVLATHFPVCWDCHITETFCREHPEMFVDRSRISPGVHRDMFV